MYSQERAWSAKLISITDAGWPSAAARLIRRPSPSRLMRRPSFIVYSSTKVRVVRLEDDSFSSDGMSISTLKWPEFETMAPSFIIAKCCLARTFLLPVTVQKTAPILAASSMLITRNPSITASRAFVGSISVMITSAPAPRARRQTAAAPAITGDDELRSREQEIRGADDAVDRRLPGAVTIVEEMFGVSIVDRHDRIAQHAFLSHGAQANHTGGRLLGTADHILQLRCALGVQHGDEVGA